MRNQFLGDARDYFKYALLETLALETPRMKRLTFIPMMQPDEPTGHGQSRPTPLTADDKLAEFLAACRRSPLRDISLLRPYFESKAIDFFLYAPSVHVEPAHRDTYFNGIPTDELQEAIIFFDPDNGLAPARQRHLQRLSGKYLGVRDLRRILLRAGETSICVIYQHRPMFSPASSFYPSLSAELGEELGMKPIYCVADGVVGFFVLSKTETGAQAARAALQVFSDRHGKTTHCWPIQL